MTSDPANMGPEAYNRNAIERQMALGQYLNIIRQIRLIREVTEFNQIPDFRHPARGAVCLDEIGLGRDAALAVLRNSALRPYEHKEKLHRHVLKQGYGCDDAFLDAFVEDALGADVAAAADAAGPHPEEGGGEDDG